MNKPKWELLTDLIPPELIVNQPPNSTARRLRAITPGCEDAVSDVYYVLHTPQSLPPATMSAPTPTRRLKFVVHPHGLESGNKLVPAPEVTVLDADGNRDTTYRGDITVEIDKTFKGEFEGNREPMRLRATAPGCEPAVSKIFYVTSPNIVTNEVMSELLQGTRSSFILVSDGKPQLHRNELGFGMYLAISREAAKILAHKLEKRRANSFPSLRLPLNARGYRS